MSVATELRSPAKPDRRARAILGPAGNRVRVLEEAKRKKEGVKKPNWLVSQTPSVVVRSNSSVDSTGSSESAKMASSKRRTKPNESKSVKVVPEKMDAVALSPELAGPVKRCDWITPNSDPLYTSFHDEEWGVPVHDDKKLFELLVLSQALAEFTWLSILDKREIFKNLFDNFDPSSVAKFTEKKLLLLRSNGSTLLSEPKLRAVVDNANQILKIQQECGSFSNYLWTFVNHKPIRNAFRYARQVPVKTPKAELLSKDLMRRGFRCVGPSVVYSFMQVAGLVNDHLITCFRYQQCNNNVKEDIKSDTKDIEVPNNAMESTCSSHD